MIDKLVWGGQVRSGLRLMKKSRVEDVYLPDLLTEIAEREKEHAGIQAEVERVSQESLKKIFRFKELEDEIDDLRVLENAVREGLLIEA